MSVDILPGDVINYMTGFLCFADVMSCWMVCRRWRRVIRKPDIVKIVKHRLLDAVPNENEVDTFCDNLYKSGAMIAGSFILDCLYNSNFHGDVDIYDQRDPDDMTSHGGSFELNGPYNKFSTYLYNSGFKYTETKFATTSHVRNFYHPVNAIKDHGNVVDSNLGKIQVVMSGIRPSPGKISTVGKCILASFDLDICKVGFDGRNLYVRSWEKLIYRIDHMVNTTRLLLSVYGYARGVHEEETMEARKKKYEGRGFKIFQHPLHQEISAHFQVLKHKNCYFCEGRIRKCPIKRELRGLVEIQAGTVNLDIFSTARWPRSWPVEKSPPPGFDYSTLSAQLKSPEVKPEEIIPGFFDNYDTLRDRIDDIMRWAKSLNYSHIKLPSTEYDSDEEFPPEEVIEFIKQWQAVFLRTNL